MLLGLFHGEYTREEHPRAGSSPAHRLQWSYLEPCSKCLFAFFSPFGEGGVCELVFVGRRVSFLSLGCFITLLLRHSSFTCCRLLFLACFG